MRESYFAFLEGSVLHRRARHFEGFPAEVTTESAPPRLLSRPDLLVTIAEGPSSVFLYRLKDSGEVCGDTWHQSIEEARDQAEFEYGELLSKWHEIPGEELHPRDFAIEASKARTEWKE